MSLPSPWSGPLGFESVLVGFRAAFVEGRVLLKPLLEQTQGRKRGGGTRGSAACLYNFLVAFGWHDYGSVSWCHSESQGQEDSGFCILAEKMGFSGPIV